jgi:hypothetical protein
VPFLHCAGEEKRRRKCQERKNGIRDRRARWQLHLRKEGTSNRNGNYKVNGCIPLHCGEPVSGYFEGVSPFHTEKDATIGVRAGDVGAPVAFGSFAPHTRKKKTGKFCILGRFGTLSGTHLGRAFLRREQREPFKKNHRETQAKGKEGETDRRRHEHRPQKRSNGGTPAGYSGQTTLKTE